MGNESHAVHECKEDCEVRIVLTFDDGPAGVLTQRVAATLKDKGGIIAAFFVQAHVAYRMGSQAGKKVVKSLYDSGHLIGIHTGSKDDHVPHPTRYKAPPYDIDGDGISDGNTGLESDLLFARRVIAEVQGGSAPKHVRAVGGGTKVAGSTTALFSLYKSLGLTHVCWNVDSYDNHSPRPSPQQVMKNLTDQVRKITGTKRTLVVLFHDINDKTVSNLTSYINTISDAIKERGLIPAYSNSRDEIEAIFSVSNQPKWDIGSCSGIQTPREQYYIQIGAFNNRDEANDRSFLASKHGYKAKVLFEGDFWKVWIGPIDSKSEAVDEYSKIKSISRDDGKGPEFPDVFVFSRMY